MLTLRHVHFLCLVGFVLRRMYSGTKNNFVINCFSPDRFLTSYFLVVFVFFFFWVYTPDEYTYSYTIVTPSGEETLFDYPFKLVFRSVHETFELLLVIGILIHISSIFFRLRKIRSNLKTI